MLLHELPITHKLHQAVLEMFLLNLRFAALLAESLFILAALTLHLAVCLQLAQRLLLRLLQDTVCVLLLLIHLKRIIRTEALQQPQGLLELRPFARILLEHLIGPLCFFAHRGQPFLEGSVLHDVRPMGWDDGPAMPGQRLQGFSHHDGTCFTFRQDEDWLEEIVRLLREQLHEMRQVFLHRDERQSPERVASIDFLAFLF